MTKILVNECYGGFDLPQKFLEALRDKLPEQYAKYVLSYETIDGKTEYYYKQSSLAARTDKDVIALFKEMFPKEGSAATKVGNVIVKEIDDEKYPDWWLDEYDGAETIFLEPPKNHGFPEREEEDD